MPLSSQLTRDDVRAVDRLLGRPVSDAEEELALLRLLGDPIAVADVFMNGGRCYALVRDDGARSACASRAPLTPGERQVVCFVALGHANKHIAYELGIAPSTVSTRLTTAMKKLDVTTRAALTRVVITS